MTGVSVAAAWREVPTLRGRHACLEPLQSAHADGLRTALAGGGLERLWYANVPSAPQLDHYIASALAANAEGTALPFAVRDVAGALVGTTRLYGLDAQVPRLLVGYTWYSTRVQRSGVNSECKLMLLTHAFETLGCASVAFEISWHNQVSRTAVARLGAKQDGVLRNHKRHADGSLRDTVVFSIIDAEWPTVKRHLQSRLDAHA